MAETVVSQRNAKKNGTFPAIIGAIALALGLLTHSSPAPAAPVLDEALHEQVVMIPAVSGGTAVQLETTIFKPPGDGPFPLVIMNHGKALGSPRAQGRDRFIVLSREFVKRGYAVVIPMRKGFSRSTGDYVDPGCDMMAHGQLQADDLQGALEYLQTQSWVDHDHIIVAGQSYGGLTALAFGARHFPGVRGLINFAGGLKVHGGACRWQASLVQAFADYGAKTTLPSLWFYGENDQHFAPELAAKMHDAYVHAGGHAKLIAYGPFKKDAHGMSGSRDGVKIWWPETEKFLKELGMPTEPVVALDDEIKIPKTDYAAIDNIDAVPYLKDRARAQYREFLGKPFPRAFALSPSGAWSWAEDGDDPVAQALGDCQKNSKQPCKLYAVNNNVVWTDEHPAAATAAAIAAAPASAPAAKPGTQALTGP